MKNFIYIAFNKPYGILSQFSGDDPNITLSLFNLPKNVYPSGRLDKDSEGLLLLTNDGELINKLLEPKFNKEKTYLVQVENIPSKESLHKLSLGVKLKEFTTRPCQVKLLDSPPAFPERIPPIRERKNIPTSWLEIKISEGKNRQVRRMTAAIGHPTLRLIRIQIGSLKLGDMKPGEFRTINKNDII